MKIAGSAPLNERTKILHLITLSVVGGAQDNTFATCELHDRERYEVHLACNPDGAWAHRARRAAEHFHPLPALQTPPHPLRDLLAFWQIVSLLRRERFDIVHTHTAKAGFLGRLAARFCGVPFVTHTYHAFPFHDFMPWWKSALYRGLERLARPMTDFIFTLSEADRRQGSSLGILDFQRSATAYTGISFEKLDAAAPRAAVRGRLGIPEDWKVVLQVGRMEPQKAPHLLVEAFAHVVDRHPQSVLLLAGDGELRPAVEAAIARHGLESRVRILGFRDDVPDLLQAADVFAFSSLWEAMGRGMVEAMLVGRAVVVPAIYGIPEIVHHRETGWLYEAGNVNQLAGGISHWFGDSGERARVGAAARRLTRSLFDIHEMVAHIEKIYRREVGQKEAAPAAAPFGVPSSQPLHESTAPS